MGQQTQAAAFSLDYSNNVLERRQRAAAEYMIWADRHAHEVARTQATLVQHDDPQPVERRSAAAQQKVWAHRRFHEKNLHDSAMAQLRHR